MASYTINEPHPTVAQNAYAHSGRGGAGNTFRVSAATSVPTRTTTNTTTSPSSSTRFYSGRGGAGNAHEASERAAMSLDAEYAVAADAARHASASRGYVGRGGAGNVFSPAAATPDTAAGSARRDSSSTDGSEKSGFWGRLSGSYRR
ncbi:hypothetical protein RB594_000743 [Gaeumannomyces avenae]